MAATAQGVLFLMLGILVLPSRLLDDLGLAIVVAAALILLARPIALAIVLLPWRTPVGQMAVVSWAGLRGAVPVVLATIPFTAGYPDGAVIFNVAFVVVVFSAALQAPTVGALARRLGVIAHERVTVRSEIVPVDAHNADIIEISIPIAAQMHPTTLSASPPPAGARITVIHRGDETIVADGNTTVKASDSILVIAPRSSDLNEIERWSQHLIVAEPEPDTDV